jgi:phosphotransferase system HPr (HPr) family protein
MAGATRDSKSFRELAQNRGTKRRKTMERTVAVALKDGIDADIVSVLVQTACKFDSRVYLKEGMRRVNMKSIMGMMNMVVPKGREVTVIAEGDDESAAVEAVENLLAG